jgi:hypothetical protein
MITNFNYLCGALQVEDLVTEKTIRDIFSSTINPVIDVTLKKHNSMTVSSVIDVFYHLHAQFYFHSFSIICRSKIDRLDMGFFFSWTPKQLSLLLIHLKARQSIELR